jgi:hypothetical protein
MMSTRRRDAATLQPLFAFNPQGEKRMNTILLAIVVVGSLVWYAVSAARYVKSGEYETDCRLRKLR